MESSAVPFIGVILKPSPGPGNMKTEDHLLPEPLIVEGRRLFFGGGNPGAFLHSIVLQEKKGEPENADGRESQ